jgi:ribosome-associated protein
MITPNPDMSRKPTKGYFVRGQFVALGSELDLELKRELKGTDSASKTDLKRESAERQDLGEAMLGLRADLTQRLLDQGHVDDALLQALAETRRITNFEGRRRQVQYVGKLMRKLDEDDIEAIRTAITEQHQGSARETKTLHLAEHWRERLVAGDEAVSEWLNAYPDTDSQQLRALVRQARKDGQPTATEVSQGLAPRHGRAYRELFQMIRAQLNRPEDEDEDSTAEE